ncbi:MAG: hypothetical protein ACE5G0_05285 [Rhodothermales bacterium]
MKDFSKIILFASLVLLVLVILNFLPGVHVWSILGSFGGALPWIIFGLICLWFFGSGCSRCCCGWGASECEDDPETDA